MISPRMTGINDADTEDTAAAFEAIHIRGTFEFPYCRFVSSEDTPELASICHTICRALA